MIHVRITILMNNNLYSIFVLFSINVIEIFNK